MMTSIAPIPRRRALATLAALAFGLGAPLAAPLGGISSAKAETPHRLVVAGGDLTEIVFALGAGDRVVGVDATSVHPEAATKLPQIGYVRRLSAEGVLSLAPTQVLAAHDAAPALALEQIATAGVPVARTPDAATLDAIPEKIAFVGAAIGRVAEAKALAARYREDLAAVRAKIARIAGRPRTLFILTVRDGAPLVAGEGTSAAAMIEAAGGENVATGFDGYKPMAQEAIIAARPEAVVMMAQHAESLGGVEALLARPDLAATPAGRTGRALAIDGMLLLGFGPRTPDALAALARWLHGDAAADLGL